MRAFNFARFHALVQQPIIMMFKERKNKSNQSPLITDLID